MPTRRLFAVSAALAALLSTGVATMAHAAFPDRPIRLVVGYPPGGGTDVIARLFATQLTEKLKQPVVIENRAGAAGMIGSEFVANAPADGYTMIFTASDTHTINPHVYPKIRYTAYITPGSPWENGYCESFNGKFRDQWLNGELFYSLGEARVLIEQWRIHFNTLRPHQSIGKKPPAPGTWLPKTKAEKALHLSLFPAIPTPQEIRQRLSLQ